MTAELNSNWICKSRKPGSGRDGSPGVAVVPWALRGRSGLACNALTISSVAIATLGSLALAIPAVAEWLG
jgi:hypothetical protein